MSEIAAKGDESRGWPPAEGRAWLAGLALVVTADLLFWQQLPGVSLFTFFLAIGVAVLGVRGVRLAERRTALAAAIALGGALPLLEAASLWGFLCAGAGAAILALAASGQLPPRLVDLPGTLLRFGLVAPFRFVADALGTGFRIAEQGLEHGIARAVVMWVVPLILALVFVGLFAAANPLIESALQAVRLDTALELLNPVRVIFWGIMIGFAWPFLVPRLLQLPTMAPVQGMRSPKRESVLFGSGAILRALVLFNALFAVQTMLDIAYLWGGVALPDGMTYADYAHRGAYPLIATALLAAAFVLAAMRPGGAAEQSRPIRLLVYAFIAQNVLLVISSILRLDLYVEVYSLTELRVAAGIWMGLVAIGLVLILARIAWGKSNRWLVATNLLSLGLVLYGCAWVDFAALIARFNVEHSYELTGEGTKLDIGYIRDDLGPTAIPALDYYLEQLTTREAAAEQRREASIARDELAERFMSRPQDWRSWTFRDERLRQYLVERGDFAEPASADRTLGTMP